MRTLRWILLPAACVILMPTLASGQTGACTCPFSVDDGQNGFACTEDADSEICSRFCSAGWELLEGGTCGDVPDVPWEGACFFSGPPGRCWLWSVEPNGLTAAESCVASTGEWLGNGSVCQQISMLPKAGQAALVLILLAGALAILTLRGARVG